MRAKSILASILMFIAPISWACPPLPASTAIEELKESGSEDLSEYAFARLLKCGWQDAKPMFGAALDIARDEADAGGSSMIVLLVMNPRGMVSAFAEDTYEHQPLLAPLAIGSSETEAAVHRFEDAVPGMVALVREKLRLDQDAESMLELALASHEVRIGKVDDARRRLDRLQPTLSPSGSEADSSDDTRNVIAQMRVAMDDTTSSDADSPQTAWIVDRTTPTGQRKFHCGGVGLSMLMDSANIKSQAQMARKETDAAIGTLLQARWRQLASGKSESIPDIMHLLNQRYSKSEMQQAWADAEASIRIEENFAGLTLFGQFLPLPTAVRKDDTTSSKPNAYKERPLTQDEALALVRGTDLREAIFAEK
jgi:hypothetical protein